MRNGRQARLDRRQRGASVGQKVSRREVESREDTFLASCHLVMPGPDPGWRCAPAEGIVRQKRVDYWVTLQHLAHQVQQPRVLRISSNKVTPKKQTT